MLTTVEELAAENKALRRLAVWLISARGGRIDIHDDIKNRMNPDDYELLIEHFPEYMETVVRTRYCS